MVVLGAGIAARLHLPRERVRADFSPTTYIGVPVGIRDASARISVRILQHDNLGISLQGRQIDDLDLNAMADIFAGQLEAYL